MEANMIFSRPLVPQNPPEHAADEHPRHLHVEEKDPLVDQFLPGEADGLETGDADDAEEHQVVDIDEIAEGGNDDRQGEHPPAMLALHDHLAPGNRAASAARQTRIRGILHCRAVAVNGIVPRHRSGLPGAGCRHRGRAAGKTGSSPTARAGNESCMLVNPHESHAISMCCVF